MCLKLIQTDREGKNTEKKLAALCIFIFGSRYSRMDQIKFVEDNLQKI